MKAIILSGGKGTRLMPLTKDTPKPMLPIGGKPHLERIIDLLKKHGVIDIIFSTGYLHNKIVDYFGDGSNFGVKITYREDGEKPLGTAGAIKNCEDLMDDESFLVFNGDILTDIDLSELIIEHIIWNIKGDAKMTIALTPVQNPEQFGVAILDEHNYIINDFIEKPTTGKYGNLINAGIYVMEKSVLNDIPNNVFYMIETDVFPVLAKNKQLYYYEDNGMYWLDIGTHERYHQAQIDVENFF